MSAESDIVGGFWIIPESLDRAVEKKIAEVLEEHPQLEPERDRIRHDLLSVFNEHGHLDVEIKPKGDAA